MQGVDRPHHISTEALECRVRPAAGSHTKRLGEAKTVRECWGYLRRAHERWGSQARDSGASQHWGAGAVPGPGFESGKRFFSRGVFTRPKREKESDGCPPPLHPPPAGMQAYAVACMPQSTRRRLRSHRRSFFQKSEVSKGVSQTKAAGAPTASEPRASRRAFGRAGFDKIWRDFSVVQHASASRHARGRAGCRPRGVTAPTTGSPAAAPMLGRPAPARCPVLGRCPSPGPNAGSMASSATWSPRGTKVPGQNPLGTAIQGPERARRSLARAAALRRARAPRRREGRFVYRERKPESYYVSQRSLDVLA